jgi:tetratricopeptide (TPR) repeat protein
LFERVIVEVMKSARTAVRLAILAVVVFLTSTASNAQQPQPQKQEIYRLLDAHQFQQAEQAATSLLAKTPGDCTVNVLLGIALRGETKFEPALKAFRTAMQQCPQSFAALAGAAETAFLLNSPDAKSLVEKIVQLRPTDETGYAMLGAIDAREGDCAGAVDNYSKAPTRVRQSVPAIRQYAGCLISLDRPADAVPLLSQLLTLQDNSANRMALARAQSAAKDGPSALSTLQPLLAAGSQDSSAFLLAAEIAEAGNDTPKAVEWFRKAIEINPRNVDAYLAFSEMSFNHAAFKVGIDFLNLGIHELPSEARLYLARGVLEEQVTDLDAALRDFQEAHRLDPHLSFAEDAQGMLLSQKHDSAAALTLFARQTELHPDDPLLQYLYAEALSQVQNADEPQLKKAIAASRRAVQLEPSYQPARDLLCVLLLRHNDLDEVVVQAEEAKKRDPYDESAIYQELLAEHKLKHTDKSALLVKQLQEAKAHNQEVRTKYVLEEAQPPSAPPQ